MEVLVPGHLYKIQDQLVRFKSDALKNTNQTQDDGMLCQDLIRVLIDRVNFLNVQQPSHENIVILQSLKASLIQFETRALRRKLEKLPHPDTISTGEDGHLFCINGVK